jgi:DNA topoisomerase-1
MVAIQLHPRRPRRAAVQPPPLDPLLAAREAHLRYVDDSGPGFRRVCRGKDFRYLDAEGRPLRDPDQIARIRSLAIPPAWTDVWICPSPSGHIQATGRDARGRKQYRYHPRWREVRDETKYGRMLAFADALPRIRAGVESALSKAGFSREKVLATVVRLLEMTLIRVGNQEYARQNGSYGLTTLRNDHVDVDGATIRFHFRGKAGVEHSLELHDRRIARIVERCLDLPGEELFGYTDADGKAHSVESADVNAYIRELAGADFSAKDFRTWTGTVLAAYALRELKCDGGATATKKNVAAAVRRVARRLGNTPAVCRKCYVHPAIFQAYSAGQLASLVERTRGAPLPCNALRPEEESVLALLRGESALAAAA